MKKPFCSFLRLIKTSDIYVVTYLPILLGMSLIVLGAYIGDKMYDDGLPLKYTSILFALSMLISSISGIAQIVRQESPWTFRFSFQGPLPVIAGFLWVI
jgi:hypothetical protein